jgi:hypothetical protein
MNTPCPFRSRRPGRKRARERRGTPRAQRGLQCRAREAVMSFTGGCLCGGIRFEVEQPTKWCAHCHCSLCRRAHGAGYVTWFGVARDRFLLDDSEQLLAWYRSTPGARRGFCSRCGSTLFFEGDRWPDERHIVLGGSTCRTTCRSWAATAATNRWRRLEGLVARHSSRACGLGWPALMHECRPGLEALRVASEDRGSGSGNRERGAVSS